ncbi:MAG: diaminopimelate epimerase [Deltaproteobacteria bacterium]|nr:diaminopimelate epimerase [Deltaproteobacteria bacterium]
MKFTKLQGSGNDFVLLEAGESLRDWSQLAIAMCDRHFGIGADGLLLVLPSKMADFKMRMIDPDGSEAETCGNGLRCLVKYVLEKGLIKKTTRKVTVETIAGVRKAEAEGKERGVANIKVSMGEPKFGTGDIPVVIEPGGELVDIKQLLGYPLTIANTNLLLNLVSMGNPHAVYFWQHPVSEFPLSRLGPKVENLPIFPNRVNFEVARVMSRREIEARVWERGAGETLACGSGACAIAVAAHLYGYIDNKVDIKLPGGVLGVEWDGAGEVFLSGPAEIVFNGEWPDENVETC